MNKRNQILAAVLAVQLVVLAVVFWPRPAVASGERLFGDVTPEQITRVTIRDAAGQQVVLARGPDGWVLPEADDFPVLEDRVEPLLQSITQVQADRLVTRTPGSHQRLGVADAEFERLVEFELEGGTRHKLYLGTAPQYQVIHVRADDADEVYLALGLSASDVGAAPSTWIDTSYFAPAADQIVAITLENGNGRFKFAKDDAGTWTMSDLPEGKTLLENNVASLATRVSAMRMSRPLGKEEKDTYGFGDPQAVVTVDTRDAEGGEKTYVLRIGNQLEEEQGYVAKSATSPYYVLMANYVVEDLLERSLDSFIQAPATPTPEPTTAP